MINSKYFRVPKKKEPLQEHEIHLTSKQDPINFLKYAIFLFEKRNLPYIKFKASGSAIAGLVNISEILKKVVPGVHQVNRIYTLKYEQDYEPKEKGLDHVTIVRNVPILEVSFYKELVDQDMENWPGFQRALKPEIFERVKINFNNVIRKRNKDTPKQSGGHQSGGNRKTYQVGFRGGMKNRNNRGGSSNNTGGGFKPGFRGGRGGMNRGGRQGGSLRGGFRGGRGNNRGGFGHKVGGGNVYNNFQDNNQSYGGKYQGGQQYGGGYKHREGKSEYSRGSTVRGFGNYKSKFDNNRNNNNNNNN